MKSNLSPRRVNLSRLEPISDPHRKLDGDPDEAAPNCPDCGSSHTFWAIDRKTTQAVLCCRACPDLPDCVSGAVIPTPLLLTVAVHCPPEQDGLASTDKVERNPVAWQATEFAPYPSGRYIREHPHLRSVRHA